MWRTEEGCSRSKKSVAEKKLKHEMYITSLLKHGFLRPYYSGGVTSDDPENLNLFVCYTKEGEMVEKCEGDGTHNGFYRMHPNLLVNQTTIRAQVHELTVENYKSN